MNYHRLTKSGPIRSHGHRRLGRGVWRFFSALWEKLTYRGRESRLTLSDDVSVVDGFHARLDPATDKFSRGKR